MQAQDGKRNNGDRRMGQVKGIDRGGVTYDKRTFCWLFFFITSVFAKGVNLCRLLMHKK